MRIKQFILIAVVAIVASSCAHSFESAPTQKAAIGFGTWGETLTKAESRVQGTNTFLSGDTFNIYGYNTISGTNYNIFNGDVVTAKNSASEEGGQDVSEWKYSPLRFWDPAASSYTFFAVSPSGILYSAPVETDGSYYNGKFVSNTITFAGTDNDVLVATKKVVTAAAEAPKYSAEPVTIEFNHVASLVDVKVKKDAALPAEATLRITGASLVDIENQGAFTVTGYNAGDLKPVVTWDGTSTTTYASTVSLPLDVTIATTYNAVTGAATSTGEGTVQSLFSSYVMKPQDLSSGTQKLQLAYKVVTQEAQEATDTTPAKPEVSTSYTAEIALKDFVTTDNKTNPDPKAAGSWAQGTHYIYTVTIGANAITFSASINDWTTVNGYRYILN